MNKEKICENCIYFRPLSLDKDEYNIKVFITGACVLRSNWLTRLVRKFYKRAVLWHGVSRYETCERFYPYDN